MTPYQKIMRAYNDPKGVRGLTLSAEDVMALGQDSAIETRATNDDIESCERQKRHKYVAGWCTRCGERKATTCVKAGHPARLDGTCGLGCGAGK